VRNRKIKLGQQIPMKQIALEIKKIHPRKFLENVQFFYVYDKKQQ